MDSSATDGPRGAYAKTERRREEITLAAIAVFGARGYHGGSLRDIARELDMSLTSLTYHFPSKAELLTSVLEYRDAEGARAFHQSADRGLVAVVMEVLARNSQQRNLQRLFAVVSTEATTPEHPAHDWLTRHYLQLEQSLVELIEHDREQGRIAVDPEPSTLARIIIGALDGMEVQWLLNEEFDMEAHMRVLLRSLLVPSGEAATT